MATFSISTPEGGDLSVGDHRNTIFVQVENDDLIGNTGFIATITDIGSGSGSGTPTALSREGTSNLWSARVFAGALPATLPAANNKTVTVTATIGGGSTGEAPQIHNFRAYSGGSGSTAGSISGQSRCGNCSNEVPVPVLLQLIGPSVIANNECDGCAALNDDFFLQHSDVPSSNCSWFSDSIACCDNEGFSGFWELKKTRSRLWELRLLLTDNSTDPFEAVYYVLTTNTDECIFPIELVLAEVSTLACTGWPESITIAPADMNAP